MKYGEEEEEDNYDKKNEGKNTLMVCVWLDWLEFECVCMYCVCVCACTEDGQEDQKNEWTRFCVPNDNVNKNAESGVISMAATPVCMCAYVWEWVFVVVVVVVVVNVSRVREFTFKTSIHNTVHQQRKSTSIGHHVQTHRVKSGEEEREREVLHNEGLVRHTER